MRYINKSDVLIIVRNSGILMIGIGFICLVPMFIDFIYLEFNAVYYLVPGLISIFLGLIFMRALDKYNLSKMRMKHGMVVSALSWLWAAIVCGSVFFFITDISIVDALFESMSALTGSGITIYPDVEVLPYSVLFFRGFQQWIGGLGIIVLIISFFSKPGSTSSMLYYSEAREDRLKPSIRATIKYTLIIYSIFTVSGVVLYVLAGMPVFDAVCHTFSTISTGGMSVKNANIGYYQNDMIYFITIILMILGATSFLVHFKIIRSRGRALIHDLQFKVMISLIALSSIIIYLASSIVPMDIIFTVVSAITTTGASIQSTTAMAGWPSFVIFIIMVLMLIGGSTGSTVGALKLMRVITFFEGIYANTREIMSPTGAVIPIKIPGEKIKKEVVEQSGNFIALYFVLILITWALFCMFGHDTFDSLFFTISMQGNVGLEIGQVSQVMEWPLKVIGIFNMWTGRLEIYPVLITIRAIIEVFKVKFG